MNFFADLLLQYFFNRYSTLRVESSRGPKKLFGAIRRVHLNRVLRAELAFAPRSLKNHRTSTKTQSVTWNPVSSDFHPSSQTTYKSRRNLKVLQKFNNTTRIIEVTGPKMGTLLSFSGG